MEVITISNSISAWTVFWITYWSVGIPLTFKAYFDNSRKIKNLSNVLLTNIYNMFWSFLAIILLYLIPLRAMTEYNIVVKLVVNYMITSVWFYHVHIMLHQPQLYKLIHKKHHEFSKPYALTALYASGYETIFLNTFASGLGIIILQIPSPYLHIWFFLVAANTVVTHSGYKIPYILNDFHDLHHSSFSYNYGTTYLFDMLYGTFLVDNNKVNDKNQVNKNEVRENNRYGPLTEAPPEMLQKLLENINNSMLLENINSSEINFGNFPIEELKI